MQYLIAIASKVLALLAALMAAEIVQADQVEAGDVGKNAMTYYVAGHVAQAINSIESALPQANDTTRLNGRLADVSLLMEVCLRTMEWSCIAKWAPAAITLSLSPPTETNEVGRAELRRQADYYYALMAHSLDTSEAAREANRP